MGGLCYFNPRAPYGARPARRRDVPLAGEISIHAPHTGRDRPETHAPTPMKQFQSTRPIRGATIFSGSLAHFKDISIHAPHTGRDPAPGWRPPLRSYFNPRAPYGARHVVAWRNTGEFAAFQSTRPIRGATMAYFPNTGRIVFQSTRPIRGATCGCRERMCATINFNPRAPYGARRRRYPRSGRACEFQSTRPIRGATAKMHNLCSAFLQQQTIKA